MNRQKQLLAVLAVVFVLALGYAFWATPRPRDREVAPTAAPPSPSRPAMERPLDAPDEETRVRLDLLSREREKFAGYQRDIFNYPRITPPPSPPIERPLAAPPPSPMEPSEPEAVEQELAGFTFLGFLERESVKTVFLSSGDQIFLVKEGESFGEGNDFHVTDLTPERLTIRHREDSRLITIPLVEQAPLAPSMPNRTTRPIPESEADSGLPDRPDGDFLAPEEESADEEDAFSPPPEGENGFPPSEVSDDAEEMSGNDLLPPGGAVDE